MKGGGRMIKMRALILPLSFFSLFISCSFILLFFIENYQDKKEREELISRKEYITEPAIINTAEQAESENAEILPQYRELYNENPDLIGWVKIDGTPLDYPVMQNLSDGEYYLHRNFKKEYDYSGLPFLYIDCDINKPSTNLIIYGHNMKSDAMFSSLIKYTDKNYYLEHLVIRFDSLYEEAEYQIIAVVLSKVYRKSDNVFKFYKFIQAETEEEFNEFIDNMKQLSVYDTGISAAFGDQLLTLVTCSYHTENGRLAVLAKKIKDD